MVLLCIGNAPLLEITPTVAEFKEFERRFKYGWFHLNLYQMLQDLSRRLRGGATKRITLRKI